ncbi:hypothetical protein M1M25_gp066 [Tenacibaculum phage Gundel_1]|uniref:Uncharacterized protein n=1 Tax=Tenacibaculum phage Gundel_1 TaxID=2745672 RepID=A0A8E4ZL42_9CAUD|nr:hypothetical protein M1M25_gp066 [Tenacibaculum phage Gundel_1]QQV91501.1 hypothetical protein Gundel1_66 [Tenacibaculum phage Gundel_1]
MMEEKLEQKIKELKKFIEQKTDLGTANYLGKEIREICGMVETTKVKTDKETFEKFMGWMGMKASRTKQIKNHTVVEYEDTDTCDERFTKQAYGEFDTGAVFDENGKLLKGYIDSHVAVASSNSSDIYILLKD